MEQSIVLDEIIKVLQTIYDPELPVNIYDLGLIYNIDIQKNTVHIQMTLTAPGCPVAQTFPQVVEDALKKIAHIEEVHVELVWDPPWDTSRISDETKLKLGIL